MFHLVNCSNMQLFLLLDQGKGALILQFDVYICFPFAIGDIHNRATRIPGCRPCNSNVHVSKRRQLHIHHRPLENHKVVWDFLCLKNNVNNKSFLLLVWDKTPILSPTLMPIMQQNISQYLVDALIDTSSKES